MNDLSLHYQKALKYHKQKRPERTTFKPLPFVYKVNYLPNLIETPIKPVT